MAEVKYYDANTRNWITVSKDDLSVLAGIPLSGRTAASTWITAAAPEIPSTRSLLLSEVLAQDAAHALVYDALLTGRLALYEAFRAAFVGSPNNHVIAAFLSASEAGINYYVNERQRMKFRETVGKVYLAKSTMKYLPVGNDALTSLRSFGAVFAAIPPK